MKIHAFKIWVGLLGSVVLAGGMFANSKPNVIIHSTGMRPGTTLMDIHFRVEDPDDAFVKVRALAFRDGVRSFANVMRPVTFVDGTDSLVGDHVATNVDHLLTWDVAADWNVQLGQLTFEILAMDGRGLLPMDWVTIPATETTAEQTISTNVQTDAHIMDALFWLYADRDPDLFIQGGIPKGRLAKTKGSNWIERWEGQEYIWYEGDLEANVFLMHETLVTSEALPFLYKKMNFRTANNSLGIAARLLPSDILYTREFKPNNHFTMYRWYAEKSPYEPIFAVHMYPNHGYHWQQPEVDLFFMPGERLISITSSESSTYVLAESGQVYGINSWYNSGVYWRGLNTGWIKDVVEIDAGQGILIGRTADGLVIRWQEPGWNQSPTQPEFVPGINDAKSIAAGGHILAVRENGTVFAHGQYNHSGQLNVPFGLTGVKAVAAGQSHSVALKEDGTVVAWGSNYYGECNVPAGLNNVIAIAAGMSHTLALRSNGTVVAWGATNPPDWDWNEIDYGQTAVPAGLTDVIEIAAGNYHSLALKSDGTIVQWGGTSPGQQPGDYSWSVVPTGVISISTGASHTAVLKQEIWP